MILAERRRVGPADDGGDRYRGGMTAQSTSPAGSPEPYEVIHLGGEEAAIVPLADLRRLRAVQRYAPAEALVWHSGSTEEAAEPLVRNM